MFQKTKRHTDRNLLDTAHTGRCVVCSKYGCDPDHVKSKGSGGSDLKHNICFLCRRHHTEKGMIGISGMAEKYGKYKNWLLANGWYLCLVRNKWVNDLNNIGNKNE